MISLFLAAMMSLLTAGIPASSGASAAQPHAAQAATSSPCRLQPCNYNPKPLPPNPPPGSTCYAYNVEIDQEVIVPCDYAV